MRIVLIEEQPRNFFLERFNYLFLTIILRRSWLMTSAITRPIDPGAGDVRSRVPLSSLHPLTESDVCALIQKSAEKSCLMDPMPTSLVVDCLDVLLPVITCIVNSSLSSGYFPALWREALVNPILKKAGLDPVFKNLRAVSNLQFLSKLTERTRVIRHSITLWSFAYILRFIVHIENTTVPSPELYTNVYGPPTRDTFSSSRSQCCF